jgi:nicotinamidase-related amidase
MSVEPRFEQTAIRTDLGAIFVSLELSRSVWLITSLSPGAGETMSKHSVRGGDVAGLLMRFAQLQEKAHARTGQRFPIIAVQEAGLDGFWIHRVLESEGIESHVVDPASIAVSRRCRRAKTDKIDGEALVRTLLAYKRGEPRVCAMVRAPTPEAEDRRRISRERKTLTAERVQHVNRIKGLLFAQGIGDYEPLHRDRRTRLDALTTGDGRPLPVHLKAEISRELDRLERMTRAARPAPKSMTMTPCTPSGSEPSAAAMATPATKTQRRITRAFWRSPVVSCWTVGIEQATENAVKVIESARSKGDRGIFIRHEMAEAPFFVPGSPGVEIIPAVLPKKGEDVLVKHYPNSFRETELKRMLDAEGVEEVVIVGAMSHMCIDATSRAAADFGYSTIVVHDACATRDLEFNGKTVPAAQVHAAYMAALAFAYGKVVTTDELTA